MQLFLSSKDIFTENAAIAEPAAMASRLIARRSWAFRVQPCFKCFRKMNIALCRLNETNTSNEIQRMRKAITIEKIDGFYHLPTKENFQYFLIHLQSVIKILVRIIQCAKDAHRMFIELLHRANFIETLSMFFSVTADVWTHCVKMGKSIVRLYNGFFRFYQELYDPKNVSGLPTDMRVWLAEEWTEHINVNTEEKSNKNQGSYGSVIVFNGSESAMTRDMVEAQTETQTENEPQQSIPKFKPKITMNRIEKGKKQLQHMQRDQEKKQKDEANKRRELHRMAQTMEIVHDAANATSNSTDLGEKIDRNAFEKNQTIKKVFTLDLSQFKKIDQIRNFIATEDNLRSRNQPKYSENIQDNQWKQFKTSCDRLFILGQEKLILKKFRNLWNQIKK